MVTHGRTHRNKQKTPHVTCITGYDAVHALWSGTAGYDAVHALWFGTGGHGPMHALWLDKAIANTGAGVVSSLQLQERLQMEIAECLT